MKTPLHDRNTARPLNASPVLREVLRSFLPGSAIVPGAASRLYPRLQATAARGGVIRIC